MDSSSGESWVLCFCQSRRVNQFGSDVDWKYTGGETDTKLKRNIVILIVNFSWKRMTREASTGHNAVYLISRSLVPLLPVVNHALG